MTVQTVSFDELGISEPIMQAIRDIGYEEATPIQTQAIPLIMQGHDVIGQSQTGTGKTAAFSIPAIEDILRHRSRETQVLILCPTRELAIQACEEIRKLTRYIKGVRAAAIYGGQDIERQFKQLRSGAQIVVGTPGRVMDHMRRGTLSLAGLRMVVLDEADEMLSMGFLDDIETIFQDVPQDRQTILFSATLSHDIKEITKAYQTDPQMISVVPEQLTVEGIEQYYCNIPHSLKTEALSRLLDVYHPALSMVFCNTKKQVDELVSAMQLRGYVAEGLHGDMKQAARDHVMNAFRSGGVDILIATDVAARGIDISGIDVVFNYDLPQDNWYYVHRIGRTGRAGRNGTAFTFVTGSREMEALRSIMRYANTTIQKLSVPGSREVTESRRHRFADRVRTAVDNDDLTQYISMVEDLADSGISPMQIAAALLQFEMTSDGKTAMPSAEDDRLFERHERGARRQSDRRTYEGRSGRDGGRKGGSRRDRQRSMTKIYINLGKAAGIAPGNIVGAIANEAGIPGRDIGHIDIADKHATFEVPDEVSELVLTTLGSIRIKGRKVSARRYEEQHNEQY